MRSPCFGSKVESSPPPIVHKLLQFLTRARENPLAQAPSASPVRPTVTSLTSLAPPPSGQQNLTYRFSLSSPEYKSSQSSPTPQPFSLTGTRESTRNHLRGNDDSMQQMPRCSHDPLSIPCQPMHLFHSRETSIKSLTQFSSAGY